MHTSERLDEALHILDTFAGPGDRARIDALRQRVAERRLRVLVIGEAKRGKSTLVNQLLGRAVLPTGVTPVTALATSVTRTGDGDHIEVTFADGRGSRHDLDELSGFVTEQGNPGNGLEVRSVDVRLRSALLDRYDLELVDTPGTGSIFKHNSEATQQALDSLDAAVFVATADPPISAAERDLLARAAESSVHTFVVLNKADQLDADELREALRFTEDVIGGILGAGAELYACAARRGRADSGFARFADALEQYLSDRAATDLTTALRAHAARLVHDMLDEALVTERSLELSASASAHRVALFRSRLDEIAQRQRALVDRCWAAERRLGRELNESAGRAVPAIGTSCRRETTAWLDAHADLGPDAIEGDGRDVAVRAIRTAVDAWRADAAHDLDGALAELAGSVERELDTLLVDLRAASHELLDIDMSTGVRRDLLLPGRSFWYDFDPGVGWELPLAGLARRALPGRAARARATLLAELAGLTDRQVGRARADLQKRLADSVRALSGQLRRHYDDTIGRVIHGLDDAVAISDASAAQRAERSVELGDRIRGMSELAARLDTAS